jgi:recombinational DNA repair protein RecT
MQNKQNEIQVKQNNDLQLTNEMQMVLPFAESYNQIFSGKVDENEAKHLMIVFAQKLGTTFNKAGVPAIKACTPDSIRQAAYEVLSKRLDLSKSQTSLIVYNNELKLQDEYFGRIVQCKRDLGINIRGTIIHEGDSVEISIDSCGLRTIKHNTSWNNYKNKITGAWAAAYNEKGELIETDIMTYDDIWKSWLQSKGGIKDTHRNFANEMCRKTVEARLAKHIYNKSDSNTDFYDSYDSIEEYEENDNQNVSNENVVEVDFGNNSNSSETYTDSVTPIVQEVVVEEPVVVPNYADVNVANEQVYYDAPVYEEPKEEIVESPMTANDLTTYTANDIESLNLNVGTEIVVKYNVYKDLKVSSSGQKWANVPNTYDQQTYTVTIKRLK